MCDRKKYIKTLLRKNKVSNSELACLLDISYQSATKRLQTDNFSFRELVKIAELVNAEVCFIDRLTKEPVLTLENEPETLAERLKYAMKEKNILASQLSRESGVTRQAISVILKGKGGTKSTTIQQLADALDVSPIWLAGEKK